MTTTTSSRAAVVTLWAGVYLAALGDYGRTWESWRACDAAGVAAELAHRMSQDRHRLECAQRAIEDAGGTIEPWTDEGDGRIYDASRRIVARF